MKVKITQEDINEGEPGEPHSCPIALRLTKMGFHDVSVGNDDICFSKNGEYYCVDTPEDAQDFISCFDDGEPVSPMEFELNYEDND